MSAITRNRILTHFIGLVGILTVANTYASTITINLTGQVYSWDGALGTQFSVGDALNMHYSYESDAVDLDSSSNGRYALTDFSGTLGSYAFSFVSGNYDLYPDPSPFGDQIFANANVTGDDVAGASLAVGSAWFRDYNGALFTDDSLITFAPDLSLLETWGFFLRFDIVDAGSLIVRSTIDSATLTSTSIPEPTSYALLALGLFGLAFVRRKQC